MFERIAAQGAYDFLCTAQSAGTGRWDLAPAGELCLPREFNSTQRVSTDAGDKHFSVRI